MTALEQRTDPPYAVEPALSGAVGLLGSASLDRTPVLKTILVEGRRSTVLLEPAFWAILGRMARERGLTTSALCSEIAAGNPRNLTAELRLQALGYLAQMAGITELQPHEEAGPAPRPCHLVIAAGEGIHTFVLPRYLEAIHRRWPGLSIDLVTHGAAEGAPVLEADIYIFPQLLVTAHPDLRGRRVGTMYLEPWISRSYRDRFGRPGSAADLRYHGVAQHRDYAKLRNLEAWNGLVREHSGPQQTRLQVDNTTPLLAAVQKGLGVGLLPTYTQDIDPDLEPLDVDLPELAVPLWLMAHTDVLRDPSVRPIYDHLVDCFTSDHEWFGIGAGVRRAARRRERRLALGQ